MYYNKHIQYSNTEHNGQSAIALNASNCMQYLLMYIDDELTTAQMASVDDYIITHPEYAATLAALQQTKVLPTTITYNNNSITYPSITAHNYTEYMLLAVDGELTTIQYDALQQYLALHAHAMEAFQELLQCKLLPTSTTVECNKLALTKANNALYNTYDTIQDALLLKLHAATTPEQDAVIAQWSNDDAKIINEIILLQHTIVPIPTHITYNQKNALLKKENKIIPMWLRYAAAASIAACIVTTAITIQHGTTTNSANTVALIVPHNNAVHTHSHNKNNNYATSSTTIPYTIKGNTVANTPAYHNSSNTDITKTVQTKKYNVNNKLNTIVTVTNYNTVRNSNINVDNQNTANSTQANIATITKVTVPPSTTQLPAEITAIPIALTTSNYSTINDVSNTTDSDVTILGIAATKYDKKERVKKLKNKISSYLQSKFGDETRTSIAIGKYEIAVQPQQ